MKRVVRWVAVVVVSAAVGVGATLGVQQIREDDTDPCAEYEAAMEDAWGSLSGRPPLLDGSEAATEREWTTNKETLTRMRVTLRLMSDAPDGCVDPGERAKSEEYLSQMGVD